MEIEDDAEKINLKHVKWRMLSLLDIAEFKRAAQESTETNYEYLAYGYIFNNISASAYLLTYTEMLFNDPQDHYGLFYNGKLLAHVSFSFCFGRFGTEVIGWVRSGYHNNGIGELALKFAEGVAFNKKKFNYITLNISQKNGASRRVAEKAGFVPILKFKYSVNADDCSIIYLKINPRIDKLARQFRRRSIDVMNNPASIEGLAYFLNSDPVNEFFSWPFPKFDEGASPVDPFAFDDFVARINLNPEHFGI